MMKAMKLLLGTGTMLALTASIAAAQDCREEPEKKVEKKTDAAAQGAVIAIDPNTHALRPATEEEMRSLHQSRAAAAAARRGDVGMRAIHHHTGAEGLVLDDSYMTSMTAVVGKDGKVSYQCVDGAKSGSKSTKKDGAADVK